MYDDALPVAAGETPCANSAKARPYSTQLVVVVAAAIQSAFAGTCGTTNERPVTRPASEARRGTANGVMNSAAIPPIVMISTVSAVPPPRPCSPLPPTAEAISPPALSAMTANPAITFTKLTTRLDPIAPAAPTPSRCASAPIAAICQTFPGTYLPRFDTNQIRAAVGNGNEADQTRSVLLHASMRSR